MFSNGFVFLQAAAPAVIDGGSSLTWLVVAAVGGLIIGLLAYMGTRSNSQKVDANALKDEIRAETDAKLGDMASRQRVSDLEKEVTQLRQGHENTTHLRQYHEGQTNYSPKN